MIKEKIAALLEDRFLEEEFKDCFLVEIKESPSGNKLDVYIESDDQLSYGVLRKISRGLEAEIEENGWMPEKYTLDVSSPGVGRPLKHHRQYIKNIGRNIEIDLASGETTNGKLIRAEEEEVEIEIELSKKEAKARGEKVELLVIQKKDIMKAKIKISFK